MIRRRPALAGLLALCAVLAGTIALGVRDLLEDDGAMIPAAPTSSLLRPGTAAPGALPAAATQQTAAKDAAVDAILARPLFAPTRRPPRAAPAGAGPDAAPVASLPRLAGVLVNGSDRSVIFAATAEGGRPIVVSEGGEVGGYVVQSIEAGQVTLAGPGGTRRVLRPSFAPRSAQPGGATQPPPPPPPPFGMPPASAPAAEVMPSLRGLPGFGGSAALAR